MSSRIAVLGAGLQGTCAAFGLAEQGYRVDLFDRNSACVTQASAQNEGKIHLGYVYANDPSRKTARLMVRGALCFAPLMRRWLGTGFDRVPQTTPFLYAIHAESLVSIENIRRHFDDCVTIAADMSASTGGDYFGRDILQPVTQLSAGEMEADFDPKRVGAAFETREIGVDPEAIAALIRECIISIPEINLRLQTVVRSVSVDDRSACVEFEADGARHRETYDYVVNALWDGRLAIDASTGDIPTRPWLWRLRRNLRVETQQLNTKIPSVTILLGPFGDIANYGDGKFYLSWYPVGRIGRSQQIAPLEWERPDDLFKTKSIETGILDGLIDIVPSIEFLKHTSMHDLRLTEGIIFAWGASDITDHRSLLHERYDVGVRSRGRYHSIDTGKYTLAPLFATEVVARIMAEN